MQFQFQSHHPEDSGEPGKPQFGAASFFKRVKRCAADVGLLRQIVLAQIEGLAAHSDLGADGG
jgi:hypothetical protein